MTVFRMKEEGMQKLTNLSWDMKSDGACSTHLHVLSAFAMEMFC